LVFVLDDIRDDIVAGAAVVLASLEIFSNRGDPIGNQQDAKFKGPRAIIIKEITIIII
jgi:hypothetical protein